MELSKKIAHYIASCRYEDIPAETIEITKTFIMDTIGVGFAGTTAPGYETAFELFKGFGGREDASVMLGGGLKLPAPEAAFLNALAFHACDFDDTYDEGPLHCYCTVLSAALAAAEVKGGVTGKEFLTAIVVGVDLCARLGRCISTPLSWVRTATCGTFAAAAAAAKIFGLDDTGTLNALGVVYSQTAGNSQCQSDGGLSKRMQPGFSARAGVLSAMMAQRGITGAVSVFEGPFGYFNLYERGAADEAVFTENLGKEFLGQNVSIKPYPSCRMTHAAIDAALLAREKYHLTMDDIESVTIYTSAMCRKMTGEPFKVRTNPQVDAQFSIAYTVTVALTLGIAPSIAEVDSAFVSQPRWEELAKKINVVVDPNLNPKEVRASTLVAKLKTGEEVTYHVDTFRGHPENPLSEKMCRDKFTRCAELAKRPLTEAELDTIIQNIHVLDKAESLDAFVASLV